MSHLSPLVLFVDDDADTREMYQLALNLEGFAVLVAANVADAIRCVMETPPAVIVTDLAMPGMDGHELIGWLHEQGRFGTPVIALTGWASPSDANRARQAGCAAVCVKPCLPASLAATIRSVMVAHAARA
jgi:CheY-like chemotaxis protein